MDEEKCTACGACVKACPKAIIELRAKGKKSRRVYVSCVNKDKGAVARKAGTVNCIGCGKCVKTFPFEAIALENNLAYIDYNKCKSCRKCVEVCPQNTIIELNFPPRKPKGKHLLPKLLKQLKLKKTSNKQIKYRLYVEDIFNWWCSSTRK